jgi:hypothetical protein
MFRLLALAGLMLAASSALADGPPAPGRFQVAPGEGGGFVRLDTRTGTVSHCGLVEGVWRCDAVADPDADARLSALSAEVARLSASVAELSARVDALAAHSAPIAAKGPRTPGFADSVITRFLDLVRKLKHGPSDDA